MNTEGVTVYNVIAVLIKVGKKRKLYPSEAGIEPGPLDWKRGVLTTIPSCLLVIGSGNSTLLNLETVLVYKKQSKIEFSFHLGLIKTIYNTGKNIQKFRCI